MKSLIAIVLVMVALTGCTKPEHTKSVVESAGYSEVVITGYEFFGCSEDDVFHTGFTAKGPKGQPVKGVVCAGWFKGATIRLD